MEVTPTVRVVRLPAWAVTLVLAKGAAAAIVTLAAGGSAKAVAFWLFSADEAAATAAVVTFAASGSARAVALRSVVADDTATAAAATPVLLITAIVVFRYRGLRLLATVPWKRRDKTTYKNVARKCILNEGVGVKPS
jgi:hypothetical protein